VLEANKQRQLQQNDAQHHHNHHAPDHHQLQAHHDAAHRRPDYYAGEAPQRGRVAAAAGTGAAGRHGAVQQPRAVASAAAAAASPTPPAPPFTAFAGGDPAEEVQIFVKRGGVVMRCDGATGFVPMTEAEKNNSPHRVRRSAGGAGDAAGDGSGSDASPLQPRRDLPPAPLNPRPGALDASDEEVLFGSSANTAGDGGGVNRRQQFHPQVQHAYDDDGNELLGSVRMAPDGGSDGGRRAAAPSDTDGDSPNAAKAGALGAKRAAATAAAAVESPSALSTVDLRVSLAHPAGAGLDAAVGRARPPPPPRDTSSPSPIPPSSSSADMVMQQQQQPTTAAAAEAADLVASLRSLLGDAAASALLDEAEVFAKSASHVRHHPRANAVFATRIRSMVESAAVPKLTRAFGVATEEEGFAALLVMLGQLLCCTAAR
jgi:hypothetical protein